MAEVKRRRGRAKWVVVSLLAVGGVVVVAMGKGGAGGDSRADQSLTATVRKGDLEVTVLETGKVEPKAQAQIKSRVGGLVTDVTVHEGQVVKKGHVLIRLEPTDYRREVARVESEIEQQRLTLEFAELSLDRSKRAREGAVGTEMELDQAKNNAALARARIASARVSLATAQDRLRYTQVEAPIEGTVTQRNIQPGEVVVPGVTATVEGRPLLVIADLRTLLVKIDLNQIDVAKVKVGQQAEVTLDALPGKKFTAAVTKVAPAAVRNATVDVFPVEATLGGSQDLTAIKPGMTADVKIHIDTRPGVLLLPIEAVTSEKGKHFVTPLDAGGTAGAGAAAGKGGRRDVQVGARNDRDVEITTGLKEGDRVAIKPPASAEVKF